ncbi:MAG: hypothetical protein OXG65_10745 [Chloroflexi bacterium]|nr:hypothetical protein [Chloroflexota bacterium]
MTLRTTLLLMLAAWGSDMRGKTFLQKNAYFMSKLLGEDLGFRPHYYGPYSPKLEMALGELRGMGIVSESVSTFGVVDSAGFQRKRYDYSLTADGRHVANAIQGDLKVESEAIDMAVKKIKRAGGDMGYWSLAVAAKTHFVISASGSSLSEQDVVDRAEGFGWDVDEKQVCEATEFLGRLELIARD